ncbi:LCP family protein [Corynebacterium sp.]|uniref:LCP family protein n=1 Tax=Corynebacterium sp. TaxID=1720 RepID=UPI0026DC27DF|nr:LCP family protein [Corynebacterium sp.]MDO4611119.1 LCP family protein [Corynebacterium sp.]
MNAPQGPDHGRGADDGREIVRDAQGRPRLDRFGRPIYRSAPGGAGPRGGDGRGARGGSPNHGGSPRGFDGPEPRWQRPLRGDGDGRRAASGRPRDPRLDPAEIRRRAAEARARNGIDGGPGRHRAAGAPGETRVDLPSLGPRGANHGAAETRLDSPAADGGRPLLPGQDDPRFPPRGYRPGDPRYGGGYRNGRGPDDRRGRRGRGGRPPRRRPGCGCGCLSPGRTLLSVLAVLLLVVGGGLLWADTQLNRTEVFAGLQDRPGRTIATNWLIIGSDSRAGLSEEENAALNAGGAIEGQRTDTIMIAHLPVVGKPTLVSIPRDSYVEIPGYGMDKINAAFAYGGAPLLVETVEKSTGVRIDHYAEVGLGGFAHIVDGVGGITLCPDQAIDDPLAGINIHAGCQKFDGRTALGYVRTRATAQGDLDRVERQREFMGALMGKLRSPGVLLNPLRLIPTTDAALESMTVADGDHSWHLARLVAQMAFGVTSETVPVSGGATVDVGDVLYWDEAGSRELFDRIG